MAARQISNVKQLVPPLLAWFDARARDLPWRRTRDPYAIWVSEIMLQQTQVKTVIPYWERWMRELPTLLAAANTSPAKLHKLWEGLGYYTRVRNLQKAARQIIAQHGGKFPESFDDILALPGIGRYTAGAIASIAFNQPRPILDGNVIRVLTRVFGIATDPREKQTNAQLWQLAEELVHHATRITHHATSCSHLNQSLMELGALVCTPRSPNCPACPVQKLCVARKKNLQGQFPNLGRRTATTERRFIAFIIERAGKFLVRQRPAGVVNAHLWEFPNIEILGAPSSRRRIASTDNRAEKAQLAGKMPALPASDFRLSATKALCTIKHSITRYRITLEAWRAELASSNGAPVSDPAQSKTAARTAPGRKPALQGKWRTLAELHQLAFTGAHRKILHALNA